MMDAADLQENYGTASSPNKVSDFSPLITLSAAAGEIAIVCFSFLAYILFY